MKKSELKKIIKEELTIILKESKYSELNNHWGNINLGPLWSFIIKNKDVIGTDLSDNFTKSKRNMEDALTKIADKLKNNKGK